VERFDETVRNQRVARLNFLLDKAGLYSRFLKEKLQKQLQEEQQPSAAASAPAEEAKVAEPTPTKGKRGGKRKKGEYNLEDFVDVKVGFFFIIVRVMRGWFFFLG
jgi:hypothetical protein